METIGKIVSVLSNQIHKFNNRSFRNLDISSSEAIILMRIYNNENISLECLSKMLFIDKSATTRLVKMLEDKNYLYKNISNDDKRKYCLTLSDKGIEMIPGIQELFNKTSQLLLTGISKEEEVLFRTIVDKMINNVGGIDCEK